MRLIRHGAVGAEKPGLLLSDGSRRDCSAVLGDYDHAFFTSGGLERLRAVDARALPAVPTTVRWAAPVARPRSLFGIGLNYRDHALEAGMAIPTEPILFMKASSALAGPDDDLVIPPGAAKVDWEVELAVVIGRDAWQLPSRESASACIAGYCLANDVSERAWQLERGGQWSKGKSAPGFCPLGPWLASADEIEHPGDLALSLAVNGQRRQHGSTRTMIFDVPFLVQYLSGVLRLEAGDVIVTGTPPGVGMGLKPAVYLKAGDVIELEGSCLGRQRQRCVAPSDRSAPER